MFTACTKMDWPVPCMDCLDLKIKGLTNKNESSIINIEHKDYLAGPILAQMSVIENSGEKNEYWNALV
jgi:hypothetical protein